MKLVNAILGISLISIPTYSSFDERSNIPIINNSQFIQSSERNSGLVSRIEKEAEIQDFPEIKPYTPYHIRILREIKEMGENLSEKESIIVRFEDDEEIYSPSVFISRENQNISYIDSIKINLNRVVSTYLMTTSNMECGFSISISRMNSKDKSNYDRIPCNISEFTGEIKLDFSAYDEYEKPEISYYSQDYIKRLGYVDINKIKLGKLVGDYVSEISGDDNFDSEKVFEFFGNDSLERVDKLQVNKKGNKTILSINRKTGISTSDEYYE